MALEAENRGLNPDSQFESRVKIEIKENPHGYPKGVWLLEVELPKSDPRVVPVYNCRIESHHRPIARAFAEHRPGVAFGVGLYGLSAIVHDPRIPKFSGSDEAFFKAKSKRSKLDRIPILIPPKNLLNIMDLEKIHPEFQEYFRDREEREFVWQTGVALHIIGPVKDNVPSIHNILKTTPDVWEQKNAPESQRQPITTASFFWWDDPDWADINDSIEYINPNATGGISSFNEHSEAPAWNFDDVLTFIKEKEIVPFDIVVRDPIGESVGVRSSFAQIAVPLVAQEPVWKVYRNGPTDLNKFVASMNDKYHTNHKIIEVEGVKLAARGYQPGVNLDDKVREVQRRVYEDYTRRHPKIGWGKRQRK